jgi:hypothetical protein
MWRKAAFVFILLAIILFIPTLAFGQGQLKLASLEVDLWPEYDRPEVLVIYRLGLPPNASLPVEFSLRIPAASGAPNAVAAKQPDGSLITLPYTTQADEEWTIIKFTATTPETQVEYYDPGLKIDGSQRQYQYAWTGDYAIDNLSVQVQQPFDAREMAISPDMGPGERGQDGLIYYTGDYGSLNAGQPFNTSLNYLKDSDTLTATSLTVDPISPIDESAQGRSRLMSSLPWVFGGLGLLLLVGGGLWYWHSGRNKAEQTRRPRHKPAAQRPASTNQAASTSQEHIYCSQCGKRAGPGDRFCRACGTQIRAG